MNDLKRQEIKNRIAAGEERNGTRGHSAASNNSNSPKGKSQNSVIGFARNHPIATVAGALVIGALVYTLLPSPETTARKTRKRAAKKASAWSSWGLQALLAAFQHVLRAGESAARSGEDKLEDLAETLPDTARDLGREALSLAERSVENARVASRDAGDSISRSVKRLTK